MKLNQHSEKEILLNNLISSRFVSNPKSMQWSEVIGQEKAKQALREAVEYPFKYPWFY